MSAAGCQAQYCSQEGIGEAQLVTGAILMGISFVLQRGAMVTGIGPLTYNACRLTVSTILLFAFRPCLQHVLNTAEKEDMDILDSNEKTTLLAEERVVYTDDVNTKAAYHSIVMDSQESETEGRFKSLSRRGSRRSISSKSESKGTRTWGDLLFYGCALGITNFFGSILLQVALITVPVATAGFITSLYVVVVPMVEYLIPGRNHGLMMKDWVAAALSVVGLYVLTGCASDHGGCLSGEAGFGEILLIIGMFCWVGSLLASDAGMSCADGVSLTCAEFCVCGGLSIITALIFEPGEWSTPYTSIVLNWQGIVLVGVTEAMAFLLSTVGQLHTPATRTALLCSMEAIFAAVFGYLFLSETLSGAQLLGCAIVFIAIVISSV